jgi:AraC family transcriptional regulator
VPNSWGRKFECNGAAVTNTLTGPNSIHLTTNAHFFLIMFSAQPERSISINSDRSVIGVAPVGCIEIVPNGSELFSRWLHYKHNLLIAISEDRLQELANRELGTSFIEFHLPKLGVVDAQALAIATQIRNELMLTPLCYQESIESLLTLFGIHVIRNYTALNRKPVSKVRGGLTPSTRKRVIDYIHANLSRTLTIDKLAAIADLSPSYFARAFQQSLAQTPHEFIVTARLHAAKNMVLNSNVPFREISVTAGFSSNSHMTSLMKKVWGQTPSQIRNTNKITN